MSSLRPISIHIHGAHQAPYVPLDVRGIRSILGRMVDYLLNLELGIADIQGEQDSLLLQAPVIEAVHQYSHSAVSMKSSSPLHCSTYFCDTLPLSAKSFPATCSGELNLSFVRDVSMYAANKRHMNCASPTNILSFPLYTSPNEGILVPPMGDMLVSVDTVRREAFIYGQEPTEYAISLLAHGMAHMAGLDHSEYMLSLEQALLAYSLSRA